MAIPPFSMKSLSAGNTMTVVNGFVTVMRYGKTTINFRTTQPDVKVRCLNCGDFVRNFATVKMGVWKDFCPQCVLELMEPRELVGIRP